MIIDPKVVITQFALAVTQEMDMNSPQGRYSDRRRVGEERPVIWRINLKDYYTVYSLSSSDPGQILQHLPGSKIGSGQAAFGH